MKEGFAVARKAATSWESGAFFVGSSFMPADEKTFKTGKRTAWEFRFATRAKCEAGRLRVVTIRISGDPREIASAKKTIDGYGITVGGEVETDPPLPQAVDEDFMDADRVLRTCEKHGATKSMDHQQLDVTTLGGGPVWIARIAGERVLLHGKTGTLIYRGKDDGAREALDHFSKTTSFKAAEEALRKELAKWGKEAAADLKFTAMEGAALSAESFAKGAAFESSAWEFILPKPEPRWFRVEVINGKCHFSTKRLTSLDDPGRFTDPKELKPVDSEPLRKALADHAKLKEWLAAGKGALAWKVLDAKTLQLVFSSSDGKRADLTLRYDLEKAVIE
jgi:hypothetical protein